MVFDQLGEPLDRLVVGGVRLEDQVRVIVDDAAQLRRAVTLVVEHLHVVELHARLDDEADHALPGRPDARILERLLVSRDGGAGGVT